MSTTPAPPAASPGSRDRSGGNRGWWRNGVIYQVYVRSFQDSDGDGIGDLGGVRARLPYLRSLGVDGIWLNPFYASPQHDHGYDVSDYLAVHHEYGDLPELRPAGPRRPPAGHQGHRRRRAQPLLDRARVVHRRRGRRTGQPRTPPLPLRRRHGRVRRAAPQQLALHLRRARLAPDQRTRWLARASGTSTRSPPSRPTSTGATRTSRSTSRRCSASGSTVESTASASTWHTASTSGTGCRTTSSPSTTS